MAFLVALSTGIGAHFAAVYGQDGDERANCFSAMRWGRTELVAMAGWTESFRPGRHPLVVVVDSTGDFKWGFTSASTAEQDGGFHAVTVHQLITGEEGFVFAGWTDMFGNPDIVVVKLDPNGLFEWGYVYPAPGADSAFQVINAGYGLGYVVCGLTTSFGPEPKPNALVIKLSRTGAVDWARVYSLGPIRPTSPHTELRQARPSGIDWQQWPEHQIAVVGRTRFDDTLPADAFCLMLDIDGNPQWCRLFAGAGEDRASSVMHLYDTLVVAGWTNSTSTGDADIFLWKLRVSTGNLVWANAYGHPGVDDIAEGSQCLCFGGGYRCGEPLRYMVCGSTEYPHSEGTDMLYFRVWPSGLVEWVRRHPSSFGTSPSEEVASAIDCGIALDDPRYLLAGWSDNPAFTRSEDFHLLVTNEYGHVPLRRCTRTDELTTTPLNQTNIDCRFEACHLDTLPYPMERVSVLTRKLCIPTFEPWFPGIPIPGLERIRAGGGLSAMGDSVYCLVGGGSNRFLAFDIEPGVWSELPSLPAGPGNVGVGKGGCITNDRQHVFAAKGNNTQELYRYFPNDMDWQQLPEPGFSRGITGGAMAHHCSAASDHLYFVCGSNNDEWKRFTLQTGQWEECIPPRLPARRFRTGTSLALGGSNLYLLQAGARENGFYSLDLNSTGPWVERTPLPLQGRSGKKKVEEGGALIFSKYDGNLYALKGGKTLEFWQYNPTLDVWTQMEDVGYPDKPDRKVAGGGSLTFSCYDDLTYCTVGNGSNQVWCYLPVPGNREAQRSVVSLAPASGVMKSSRISCARPAAGAIRVKCSLPGPAQIRLAVYEVSGRRVLCQTGQGPSFTLKGLASGIYLLRFEANGREEYQRLVLLK